jgi:signal transduction histidine kinase
VTESALTRRQLIAADHLVAVVYAVLIALMTPSDLPPWTVVLTVALAIPVAVRRIWPLPALVAVLVLSVAAVAIHALRDPLLAASYVLYVVGLTRAPSRPPATSRLISAASATAVVVLLLAVVTGGTPQGSTDIVLVMSGLAGMYGAWMLGRVVRDRRAAAVQAARALAEQAVSDERLRIARELHDIVAHSMGLIAVKAGVANHVLHVRPEEVSDALSVIETTSRDALVELRHMLSLLRTTDEPPTAGLFALPELAARVESTGVQIELVVDVTEPLPEAVGLAVHRIVQECLTNVTRHARASRCRVHVSGDAHAVQLEVTDDGIGGIATEGHGLIGIRERVSMYDGTFRAGPRPGGGFEVVVRLPYQRAGVNA